MVYVWFTCGLRVVYVTNAGKTHGLRGKHFENFEEIWRFGLLDNNAS